MYDTIWINAKLATMTDQGPCGMIENGVIAAQTNRIVWVGPTKELPALPTELAQGVMT